MPYKFPREFSLNYIFVIYLVLKFFSVILSYTINKEFLGNTNFDFPDLADYSECDLRPLNIFYAYTICFLSIDSINPL